MQYGAEVLPYQRKKSKTKETNEKKTIETNQIFKEIILFIISFLISRVILINSTAPFGIALILSIRKHEKNREKIIAGCGALLGYISIIYVVKNLWMYFILIGLLTFLGYVLSGISEIKQLITMFASIFIIECFYRSFIGNLSIGVSLLTSFLEIMSIFPIYFIIDYSIICFKELKTKHLYSNEEIISMIITCSLIISGTWGISIVGVSIRNIIALTFILIISYVNGGAIGAASGVAIGVIVGMSSKNMLMYVSVYGVCGLIVGIFKESGKWLTGLAYMITFLILIIYSLTTKDFNLIEGIITCSIFFLIPKNAYKRLELEFNTEKKQENLKENYINRIKGIFTEKLNNFSDVLFNMSEILNNLADNNKLEMKNKSSALVEKLADRVCGKCNMKSMCWKREIYYTYAAFEELIQNYEQNRGHIPAEIERKCIKRTILMKNAEEIVNNYIINEMWRKRLTEGRELLASQINNMGNSVEEILKEFGEELKFNSDVEKNIRILFNKNSIDYIDIMCLNTKEDRLIIKLSLKACGGSQRCVKVILPLLNKITGKCMCVSDEGCSIDPKSNLCHVTFEETPKFHVATYVAKKCKDGEKSSGDSYSFGKLKDGTYMIAISDGMGSGPQASHESKAAIELIEKFTASGFSKMTAINTVNSIMTMKFSEEEKFSTIDLGSVNLYNGELEFMKVGAVASFIKRKNRVEVIKSRSLPMGVLDKVDVDINKVKLENGDIIVMVSDGILDYDNENAGRIEWVVNYLQRASSNNPKEIVDGLVEKAKSLGKGRISDDMTAMVSKVYSLY